MNQLYKMTAMTTGEIKIYYLHDHMVKKLQKYQIILYFSLISPSASI